VSTSLPSKTGSNRYDWVDYAKGIAIFLVVYRHVFEGLKRSGLNSEDFMGLEYANIMFFSFRMPLFFIVSGVFLTSSLVKRGLSAFAGQKAKTILYPYFLWGIFQITFQILLSSYVNSDRTPEHYTYLLYSPRRVDQFWYLYALFNVTILYAATKTFFKLTPLVQVLIGTAMYFFSAYSEQQGWDIGFVHEILHYYVFFALGDLVSSYFRNPNNINFISSYKTLLVLLPVFIGAQLYFLLTNLKYDPVAYRYIENWEPALFLLIALAGCAFMLSLSFFLQQKNALAWLKVIGTHSLYIYVSHVFVASAARIFLTRVAGLHYLPLLLVIGIAVSIILPILFYRFCQARGWYFFFSLDKPKNSTEGKEKKRNLKVVDGN
jgi:fucose 4-O-acetylase-like acetyltransferase